MCYLQKNSCKESQCNECYTWVHAKCDGITKEEYRHFENIHSLIFQCPQCRLLTFTDSFFLSDTESPELSNSFSVLSESDSSLTGLTGVGEAPSSLTINNSDQTANKIRIMTVNCRNLISDRKKVNIQDLIETHKPNIILGSESHLDSCIASSEIFPVTYATPYRKDRKLGEGGVFTAVDNNYITTEVVSNCNCEIVGTKINIQESQPLYLGSYYRQPSSM